MDYSEYLANGMVSGGKASAYKSHIIKNIEVIGQRKLVIIGGGAEYDLLMKTVDALRKKGVRVPEVAFRVCTNEYEVDPDKDIRFIDELRGKNSAFYPLILQPYTAVEQKFAAMAGVVGISQETARALEVKYGYTKRDYCEMNDPDGSGLKGSMGGSKAEKSLASDAKKSAAAAAATSAQLAAYSGKMNGSRCFIIGSKSAKLDVLNTLFNERTFAANEICDFFTRTPQRPGWYLLTSPEYYLGNGKYIEGMECFVNGDVTVFEDKFKKKPTYIAHMSGGIVEGLPSFSDVLSRWDTARLMPLYEMTQLALYMGFSEIYYYGFDGLFRSEYDECGVGRKVEGTADFPAKAKALLASVKAYADSRNVKLYTMCETAGFSEFQPIKFEDIDFSTSAIFGKLD